MPRHILEDGTQECTQVQHVSMSLGSLWDPVPIRLKCLLSDPCEKPRVSLHDAAPI